MIERENNDAYAVCDDCQFEIDFEETDIDISVMKDDEIIKKLVEEYGWIHVKSTDLHSLITQSIFLPKLGKDHYEGLYCKTCSVVDKSSIIDTLKGGLDSQFEMYSYEDMMNDLDLTTMEKRWAINNTHPDIKEV